MASALVLRSDAENVRQRSDARESQVNGLRAGRLQYPLIRGVEPGRPRPVSRETRLLRTLARNRKLRFDFLDNFLRSAS